MSVSFQNKLVCDLHTPKHIRLLIILESPKSTMQVLMSSVYEILD